MVKIRNGFISNSSSSSFVVELPKTINEINFNEFCSLLGNISKTYDWENIEKICDYDCSIKKCMLQLYQDILNPNSKPNKEDMWAEYIYEDLGRDLEKTEYVVEYSDNGNYFEYIMENIFMPQVNLVTRIFSWH